jgi:hypothetical protein
MDDINQSITTSVTVDTLRSAVLADRNILSALDERMASA